MENNESVPAIKLLEIKPEAGNIKTFIFETGGLKWIAGQFQKYTLPQAGTTEAETERFFTIVSAPSEGVIRISTRITDSKFKQTLDSLALGYEIQRKGLEGDFTWEKELDTPMVLVAGGIGITPYRAILIERHDIGKKINATLLYFNRTNEIPFLEEFEQLKVGHPEFNLVPIVGEGINAQNILSRAPNTDNQTYYISGPEPMVETVGEELKKLGINLKQDWFPGYDEKNY